MPIDQNALYKLIEAARACDFGSTTRRPDLIRALSDRRRGQLMPARDPHTQVATDLEQLYLWYQQDEAEPLRVYLARAVDLADRPSAERVFKEVLGQLGGNEGRSTETAVAAVEAGKGPETASQTTGPAAAVATQRGLAKDGDEKRASRRSNERRVAAGSFAMLVAAVVLVLLNEFVRSAALDYIAQIACSFGGAGIAATLPGYLKFQFNARGVILRAGSALGVFALLFFSYPKLPTSRAIRGDPPQLTALRQQIDTYAAQIAKVPYGASAFRGELKVLSERMWNEKQLGPEMTKVAATAYRLYAASILTSPTGSTPSEIQSASPWVRRAVELYPHFDDRAELESADRFLMDVLIKEPAHIDARTLLSHEFRIAMVEARQQDIDRKVDTALDILKKTLEQRGTHAQ